MARPPGRWWFYALAACALCYIGLIFYLDVFGPGAFGMALRFSGGRAQVVEVVPGYPADRAGIEAGDRIVATAGQPIRTLFDWMPGVNAQAAVGRPLLLDIERGGQRRQVSIAFDAHWSRWSPGNWLAFLAKVTAHLVTLALALLVFVRRPRDLVALVGALWLLTISITNFTPIAAADPHAPSLPAGAATIWRSLPVWMSLPLWGGPLLFGLTLSALLFFFMIFPRPVFHSRRGWWLLGIVLVPGTILLIWQVMRMTYHSVYDPAHATGLFPAWFSPFSGALVVATVAVTFALLGVNYTRLADRNERRRLRVVVAGMLVGLGSAVTVSMASFFDLPPALQAAVRSPFVRTLSGLLFLALPLSFAYAILRHRLFDVSLIVRQGLQYAFARRLVASLVPACAVLLLFDLVLHGDQPLRTVLQSRGWIYAAVAFLAFAAHARQRAWLDTLDRRFFRERYDAQRLLREVVEEIGGTEHVEAVASQVVTRIEAALHPEYAALLVRAPHDTSFRSQAAAPPGSGANLVLRGDSKLAALARLLQKPLEATPGESGWLVEQLPREETAFLREARIGLVVPVPAPAGSAEAMLVLGGKRSEEPYSREDRDLLGAVAAGLALLAERPAQARPASAFEQCPRCGTCYDSGAVSCEKEGARLETVQLPRVLNERYRLTRRVGRGGMGTVYEAADTSLERRVAVKVIREDLVGSADAAQRFRLEARAAASFSHPNVVTIHDFGIAAETRAFLVMELLRGASLREVLREQRRFTPARTLAVVRELAAAVDAAHQQRVVHRDLKPENVFLTMDDGGAHVKVLDFGLAKFLASDAQATTVTGAGVIMGTLFYMAPEQLQGRPVEPSWDIWAMAVMAYEMLTGALPFPTSSAIVYQNAVLAGQVTSIASYLAGAPGGLEAFFARALALDPAGRQPRASMFASDLAGVVENG